MSQRNKMSRQAKFCDTSFYYGGRYPDRTPTGGIDPEKARLNIDGSKMKKGIHYEETYAPVANWSSVRLLFTLITALQWHSIQLDYVQAFPQAPVEKPLYLRIPTGFKMMKGDPRDFVLRVDHNVYGQRQAGRIWNQYLVKILT